MIKPGVETLVSVALIAEVQARMGASADDFLITVGERIGAACVFDFVGGLPQFAQTMNDMWDQLGLGAVELSMRGDQLHILHRVPQVGRDNIVWRDTLPFVVEGIYRSWFKALGPHGVVSRAGSTGNDFEFLFSE